MRAKKQEAWFVEGMDLPNSLQADIMECYGLSNGASVQLTNDPPDEYDKGKWPEKLYDALHEAGIPDGERCVIEFSW